MKISVKKIDFRPFRAWRYNPAKVGLDQVIAPPYDVISPTERDALYEKSPYNVVRLILGREPNFYEQARQCWENWSREGVLVQDDRPAYYLYQQSFRHPGDSRPLVRRALVGILHLDSAGSVLPHEATFSAPKKDRFLLLEKTKTNLSPVFGLYQDAKGSMEKLLSSLQKATPSFEARDPEGVTHEVWKIEAEPLQKTIREVLSSKKILIADGHHRFETAQEYRRQRRGHGGGGEMPFDFVMMALVADEDQGLVVLPTHRVVRSLGNQAPAEFLRKLKENFEFSAVKEEELISRLSKAPPEKIVFGASLGPAENFLLTLKSLDTLRSVLPSGKPPVWFRVEANLLGHFVFDGLWGLSSKEREGLVEYTRSVEEALRKVHEGKAAAAFFLRPTRVDTIRELADTGERMPQKTTYFYPKLASGLFFYHHG